MRTLKEVEQRHILKVLDAVSYNRTRAAEILGISVRCMSDKIKELKVSGHIVRDSKFKGRKPEYERKRPIDMYECDPPIFPTDEERLRHADWKTKHRTSFNDI